MIAFFGKTDHRLLNIFERPPKKMLRVLLRFRDISITQQRKRSGLSFKQEIDQQFDHFEILFPEATLQVPGKITGEGFSRRFLVRFGAQKIVKPSQATPGWPAMNVQRVHHFGSKDETKKVKYTLLWYVLAKQIVFLGIYNKINISIKMQKSDTHKNTERERERVFVEN